MRINNPVIRAGSVVPASIDLPFLLYTLPNNDTLLPGSFSTYITQDLTDQPAFGPDYPGQYTMESEMVFIGGAADSIVYARNSIVNGDVTSYFGNQAIVVPAGQTVYNYANISFTQLTSGIYVLGLQFKTAASDITWVGKSGALSDWSYRLIRKLANNTA